MPTPYCAVARGNIDQSFVVSAKREQALRRRTKANWIYVLDFQITRLSLPLDPRLHDNHFTSPSI